LQVSGGINGNPTSIFANAPFHSSPNATWAASAKIQVAREIYAEAGIYQASERLGKLGYHGLDFSIRANDGELVMTQIGWEPSFFRTPDISLLSPRGFAGTIWQGFVPGRDRDQLLLTYLVSGFSRNYADSIVAVGGKRPTAEHY
jgi:hypothetical protein